MKIARQYDAFSGWSGRTLEPRDLVVHPPLMSNWTRTRTDCMNSYESIFTLRGSRYDDAMRKFPHARRQEFAQLISSIRFHPEMVVADVPAGGGYLKSYLPTGCRWQGHEPCSSFTRHCDVANGASPLLPLPWSDASVNVAVSLAGVHHIEDKRPLFAELHRIVKTGGQFVLSDVARDTAVAHFLDHYVGQNNSTGHQGIFLDEHTFTELREKGWKVKAAKPTDFRWVFPGYREMGTFCNGLFDICKANIGDTIDAVKETLSVDVMSDGRYVLRHWYFFGDKEFKRTLR